MNVNCKCGGRYYRPIKGNYSTAKQIAAGYPAITYEFTDPPEKCIWTCNKCGSVREQRKRQPESRKKKSAKESSRPDLLFTDGDGSTIRVWQKGWAGDMFEVIPGDEFAIFKKHFLNLYPGRLNEHFEEDDEK